MVFSIFQFLKSPRIKLSVIPGFISSGVVPHSSCGLLWIGFLLGRIPKLVKHIRKSHLPAPKGLYSIWAVGPPLSSTLSLHRYMVWITAIILHRVVFLQGHYYYRCFLLCISGSTYLTFMKPVGRDDYTCI
jgi:hypothetical protein